MIKMDNELKKLRIERSKKRSKNSSSMRWVIIGVFIMVLLGMGAYAYSRLNSAIEVETMRVRAASPSSSGEGGIILNATGYIVAAHKIELASKVVGKVSRIGVNKGDKVREGQELVRLEDDEYRARVVEAQGQLNSLKARLAALENGSRPEEIAKARAELDQVRADLENAQVSLKRTITLVEAGVLARQTLDDAQARYNVQAARTSSFEKSYTLASVGPRREDIDAMRAQVKQVEGTLAFAQTQLENTIIRAPISGIILERNVERGEFVTTGFVGDRGAKGYVVSLADLNDLQVELDINQNDFAKLGPRQPCIVSTDAYPDRKYQGFIAEISPEANRQKATVQVKVKVANPDQYLRPEMNASVVFHAPEKSGPKNDAAPLITIPSSAVRDQTVFVVAEGRATRRKLQLAGTTSQGVQVSSGLIGGEDLIINPPADLREGQKIEPRQR